MLDKPQERHVYPKFHQLITRTALQRWQRISGVEFSAETMALIIQGSSQEDAPTWSRLQHWHFYRSQAAIADWRWLHLTSERRVRQLQEALLTSRGQAAHWGYLGRLLHHLQDMSTPSHVIPVYHDPCFADAYEVAMTAYQPDWQHLALDTSLSPGEELDALQRYTDAAQASLAWLASDEAMLHGDCDGSPFPLPSNLFWQAPSTDQTGWLGFGRRGPLFSAFGQTELQYAQHRITVSRTEYQRIYHHFFRKAVTESTALIAWSQGGTAH